MTEESNMRDSIRESMIQMILSSGGQKTFRLEETSIEAFRYLVALVDEGILERVPDEDPMIRIYRLKVK